MRQAKIEEQYFTIDQFETDYVLPEGWAAGTLGELIGRWGILTDGDWIESKDQDPHGDVRLIQLADIGDGYYKDKSSRFLTSGKAKELGCTFLEKGDVLIARMPEPLGRTCIFPGDPKPAVTAVDICIIRTGDDGADHRWIMHTVNSPEIRRRIESLQKGTTRKRISRRNLASLTLPTPPFNEQRRIAMKVEELLARVNTTKERLAKVSLILKRFRQAVLAAACSGRLTADWREKYLHFERPEELIERIHRERLTYYEALCRTRKQTGQRCPREPSNLRPQIRQSEIEIDLPASWFWTSLEDIALIRQHSMSSGPFGSALGNKDYRHSGVPVIRGQNIQNGVFLLRNYVYVSEKKASELVRSVAYPGDIVVVAVGSSGQAAIVPKDLPKAVLSQNCNKITIDESIALPEFVILFLQIEIAKNQLREKTTDTARPFLSLSNLKKTLVALPQVEEQKEIVRRVEEMFKLADAVDKRVRAATARAEKLTHAILAKAFRGELVPTEAELARREARSYETASELLARIKADRESRGASKTSLRSPKENINPWG